MQQDGPAWLIDAIIRKTLGLVAHLATTGGQRAKLAGLADQVFLELSAELEAQGLSQKVIADMFGLAVRSYQRKRRRLLESKTLEGRSLWASVLDLIHQRPRITRWEVMQTFLRDDTTMVGSVLADLVASCLVYQAGYGPTTQYVPASDTLTDWTSAEALDIAEHLVWLRIYHEGPLDQATLAQCLTMDETVVGAALDRLVALNRIEQTGATYSSQNWLIPYGSIDGWPAAVFDHYTAMVDAVCAKLQTGPKSAHHDAIGGSTYTFTLQEGHPMMAEVLALLGGFREAAHALRLRLDAHPDSVPAGPGDAERERLRISLYLGQNVVVEGGE